jgi:sporulation protein YlmC with PRC-barrel domain
MELNIGLLLGTKVTDVNGKKIGRIEEVRVTREERALLVDAYLIGASGLIERLSAWTLLRPIKQRLHDRHIHSVYEIPWQDMDLSDPNKPKARVARRDLHHAR